MHGSWKLGKGLQVGPCRFFKTKVDLIFMYIGYNNYRNIHSTFCYCLPGWWQGYRLENTMPAYNRHFINIIC